MDALMSRAHGAQELPFAEKKISRAGIARLPCSLRYTTHMDVGSAENAGAIFSRPPWMWGVRKMQEQFSADHHGKDCSYNPVAFPPSMEVRCGECGKCRSNFQPTTMARIVPTILLHFLHPWRSDVGSAENARSDFQPAHPWAYSHRLPWLLVIYDHQGWWKCRYCRSKHLPAHPWA